MRIALGSAVVLAAAAALSLPRVGRELASVAARRLEREEGVSVTWERLTIDSSAEVRLGGVAINDGGWRLACDQATAIPDLASTLGGTVRLRSLTLGDCEVSTVGATGAMGGAPEPESDPVERVSSILARVTTRCGTVRAERVQARGEVHGRPFDATVRDLVLRREEGGTRGFARVDLVGEVTVRDAELTLAGGAEPSVEISGEAPLRIELPGALVEMGSVHAGTGRRIELAGVRVTGAHAQIESIEADLVEITAVAMEPRVRWAGGTVRLVPGALDSLPGPIAALGPGESGEGGGPLGALVPEGNEAVDDAFPASQPSTGTRAMVVAEELVLALLDAVEFARAAPLPAGELIVEEVDVLAGDAELVSVERAAIDAERRLSGTVEVAGIELRFGLDLETGRSIEFEASHVDLSPVGSVLGSEVRTGGELSGRGTLLLDFEARAVSLRAEFSLREGRIVWSALSGLPVAGMDADGQLEGSAIAGDSSSASLGASVRVGGVPLDMRLSVMPDDETHRMDFAFGVTDLTPCESMWSAIPEGMLPHLGRDGVRWTGRARPRISFVHRFGDPWAFELDGEGFPGNCRIEEIRDEFDPSQLNLAGYAHAVQEGVTRTDIVVGPGTPGWVPIGSLPSYVPALMYLSEEINFPSNTGLSIGLMNKGIRLNLERGYFAYGGSTVSQQLVKNLFLNRTKNLSRKLEEAVVVWALEQTVTKERILELYLNCIEFGPDIWGIREASLYYFGHPPEELTPLEAAYLAALKPSPARGARHWRAGHSPEGGWWAERIEELLLRLVEHGGHVTPNEVAAYAPFVVAFPTSEAYDPASFPRVPRPEDAVAMFWPGSLLLPTEPSLSRGGDE